MRSSYDQLMKINCRQLMRYGLMGGAAWMSSSMLSGCLTAALFEPSVSTEQIQSVLLSEDGATLAVLSDQHHYLFETTPEIAEWRRRPASEPRPTLELGMINVDEKQAIRCGYRLVTPSTDGSGETRGHYGMLGGGVYIANGITAPKGQDFFAHNAQVTVRTALTSRETTVRWLLTPITLGLDGVLFIGMMALMSHAPAGANIGSGGLTQPTPSTPPSTTPQNPAKVQ
ncbi:hypothetical protein [Leptothrix ochracea]|uniref:hypothetical protein n=1 Tax=Leptothrix ochracea TaxID=735331 RepID=UPI0034E29DDF